MCPDWFSLPGEERPPFAEWVVYHFADDEAVDVFVDAEVFFGSEAERGFEHSDHDFGLLPEFFFAVVDTARMGAFDINAAVLVVDTIV